MDKNKKEDILLSLIVIAFAVMAILAAFGATGFYKLEPNYASVEVSRITGNVEEPILHVENGGIKNIHFRWVIITKLVKHDTKIHTVEINNFGEQREGSLDIFEREGLDYEQWPNNIIVTYRLIPEELDNFYIGLSGDYYGPRPTLETIIEANVITTLTRGNLNKDSLQAALDENLEGKHMAEIVSVCYPEKITS